MRFVYLLSALLIASASAFAPQSAVRSTGIAMNAAKQSDEVVNFKKPEFVASVSEKTGLSKAESEAALAAVLETIQEEIAAGKRITLLGFGTFKLSHRAARKGRNPQTGEELQIKASNSPSFSASKAFKERCN
eukprot:CAMPEP_0185811776 /NCGR_PEP_ID=MMETSP1322-20130828/8453_1 /TAXON_ID=265543 /ORGANISM="Minutocellus polymorphus, Strain RCC2270" /LENGTH=132 /DNA_ID=CAMNT_0028508255 /DNA_START=31 /DNA_END=429 /DNA_ORIENTATION=-